VVITGLFISYLAIYISPDKWWIPSLFGMAYPFILGVNVVFILLWLLLKPRYMLFSVIAILIGWGFVTRYIQFTGKNIEQGDIKVLSYNVQYFNGAGANQKETADKIVEFLKEQNADIICLQEVRLRKNSIFNIANTVAQLGTINHYQFARSSTTFGSVTMTRYPVLNMGEIRFENSRNMSIFTDVLIGKDTVRIFNVHLQSYLIDPNRYDVIDSPDFTEEKNLREMREIGTKFKTAVELRASQVREIRRYIDASPYHVLVCGDFNDTPTSFSYNKLRGNLKDAFVSSGKGIGRTYVGKLPSFRIDNIFHSTGFQSFNFKTYDFRVSDHLPVSCELVKN
jgi:endonuclease/exonuclease/phosphatase family metal-dependent hydrolase